jgi:hypothetical protein
MSQSPKGGRDETAGRFTIRNRPDGRASARKPKPKTDKHRNLSLWIKQQLSIKNFYDNFSDLLQAFRTAFIWGVLGGVPIGIIEVD